MVSQLLRLMTCWSSVISFACDLSGSVVDKLMRVGSDTFMPVRIVDRIIGTLVGLLVFPSLVCMFVWACKAVLARNNS